MTSKQKALELDIVTAQDDPKGKRGARALAKGLKGVTYHLVTLDGPGGWPVWAFNGAPDQLSQIDARYMGEEE